MPRILSGAIDYAPPVHRKDLRRVARPIIVLLVAVAFVASAPLAAILYADAMYSGLKPGMTRANVDRHLWAFANRRNTAYQGLEPGQFVVRYEFLRLGKAAAIQVIYNADGTIFDPQPIYRD